MNTRAQPRATPRTVILVVAACALVSVLARAAAAKNWRGIVPLSTTREGVERMLGRPAREGGGWHYYDLGGEAVVVWFAGGECDPLGLRWDVPAGTVTRIGVVPKRRLRAATLIGAGAAKTESKGDGYAVHRDERAGLTVETNEGFVVVATYRPGRADEARRCRATEELLHFPHQYPFDNFGTIPREHEWARLDNYASALLEASPLMRGSVVAYAGRRAYPGEAKARAARAKNYLVRVHRIEPWRIAAIDGGHREEAMTSLELFPIGYNLFTPEILPNVPPGEVVIVEPANRKRRPGRGVARRRN